MPHTYLAATKRDVAYSLAAATVLLSLRFARRQKINKYYT